MATGASEHDALGAGTGPPSVGHAPSQAFRARPWRAEEAVAASAPAFDSLTRRGAGEEVPGTQDRHPPGERRAPLRRPGARDRCATDNTAVVGRRAELPVVAPPPARGVSAACNAVRRRERAGVPRAQRHALRGPYVGDERGIVAARVEGRHRSRAAELAVAVVAETPQAIVLRLLQARERPAHVGAPEPIGARERLAPGGVMRIEPFPARRQLTPGGLAADGSAPAAEGERRRTRGLAEAIGAVLKCLVLQPGTIHARIASDPRFVAAGASQHCHVAPASDANWAHPQPSPTRTPVARGGVRCAGSITTRLATRWTGLADGEGATGIGVAAAGPLAGGVASAGVTWAGAVGPALAPDAEAIGYVPTVGGAGRGA